MTALPGLIGSEPLGFMASLGILRLARARAPHARLGFLDDGSYWAFIEGDEGLDLATVVEEDAASASVTKSWWLAYPKNEKRGTKFVEDLKAPPEAFRQYLKKSVELWLQGDGEGAAYAAAFGTDVAVDNKGNTKPTAFHFTAANQQFLGTLKEIRASVTREWASQSLFDGGGERHGPNLRWNLRADRNWALRDKDPNKDGTSVDGPLEWLAFRSLPLFPTMPAGSRILTTGLRGRGDEMRFAWPLWNVGASVETVRSLLVLDWQEPRQSRRVQNVFAVCSSEIRRSAQGFGNFGPADMWE